jgi:hypothetical protein
VLPIVLPIEKKMATYKGLFNQTEINADILSAEEATIGQLYVTGAIGSETSAVPLSYLASIYVNNIHELTPFNKIRLHNHVRPNLQTTTDLGEVDFRFANIYGQQVHANTLSTVDINRIDVVNDLVTHHLRPSITALWSLGTTLLRFYDSWVVTGNNFRLNVDEIYSLDEGFVTFGEPVNTNHVRPDTHLGYNIGSAVLAYNETWSHDIFTAVIAPIIGNALDITADFVAARNILPSLDETYDLGSDAATRRYKNIWVGTTRTNAIQPYTGTDVQVTGHIIPNTTDDWNLGAPGNRWDNIYANNLFFDDATVDVLTANRVNILVSGLFSNTVSPYSGTNIDVEADTLTTRHILPQDTETWDIGAPGQRFRNIYTQSLTFDTLTANRVNAIVQGVFTNNIAPYTGTDLQVDGQLIVTDKILPNGQFTIDFGETGFEFNECFMSALITTTMRHTTPGPGFTIGLVDCNFAPSAAGTSQRLGHEDRPFAIIFVFSVVGDFVPSSLPTSPTYHAIGFRGSFLPFIGEDETWDIGGTDGAGNRRYVRYFNGSQLRIKTIESADVSGTVNFISTLRSTTFADLGTSVDKFGSLHLGGTAFANAVNALTSVSAVTIAATGTVSGATVTATGAVSGNTVAATVSGTFPITTASTRVETPYILSPGTLQIQGHVTPTAAYDLGSVGNEWQNLYMNPLSGVIDTFDIQATQASITTLGVTGLTADQIDVDLLNADNIHAAIAVFTVNLLAEAGPGAAINTDGLFRPDMDNARDLGQGGGTPRRWRGIFSYDIDAAGSIFTNNLKPYSGSDITVTAHVLPAATASWDLGTTALRWRDFFARTATITNDITTNQLLATGQIQTDLVTAYLATHISSNASWAPASNDTFDLGTSLLKWRTLYAANMNVTNMMPNPGTTDTLGSLANHWDFSYIEDMFCDSISALSGATVTANNQWLHAVGTVSLPSVSFQADADTGLFQPAANTVGVACSGIQSMRVTAADIKIGNTAGSTDYTLPITRNTQADQILLPTAAGVTTWQSPPYAQYRKTLSQNIPVYIPESNISDISWPTTDYERGLTKQAADTQILIAKAGLYVISYEASWGTAAAAGQRTAYIAVNGEKTSGFQRYARTAIPGSTAIIQHVSGSDTVRLNVNDYITISAYQDSASVITFNPHEDASYRSRDCSLTLCWIGSYN